MKGKIVYVVQLNPENTGYWVLLNVYSKEEDAREYIREFANYVGEGDKLECFKSLVR